MAKSINFMLNPDTWYGMVHTLLELNVQSFMYKAGNNIQGMVDGSALGCTTSDTFLSIHLV